MPLFRFFFWYTQAFWSVTSTDPRLLDAVMVVESRGDQFAISSEGCIGLYQINPRYTPLPRWALVVPVLARAEAARHIRLWRKRAKGDTTVALAAYNCGNAGLRKTCGQGYADLVLSHMRSKQHVRSHP